MNISKQVVILSAERKENRHEKNRQLHENLKSCLDDCQFTYNEAEGVYKGDVERSLVVIVKNETDIQTLRDFAFKSFNQESILYQDSNQEAYLLYRDGTTEQLGILQEVDSVKGLDSYTVMNNKFYACSQRKLIS